MHCTIDSIAIPQPVANCSLSTLTPVVVDNLPGIYFGHEYLVCACNVVEVGELPLGDNTLFLWVGVQIQD